MVVLVAVPGLRLGCRGFKGRFGSSVPGFPRSRTSMHALPASLRKVSEGLRNYMRWPEYIEAPTGHSSATSLRPFCLQQHTDMGTLP